jgi:DNA anti-recombination protein RmuC
LDFERIQRRAVASFEDDAKRGRLGPEADSLIAQRDEARATLENADAPATVRQRAATDLAAADAALAKIFAQSDLAKRLASLADELDVAAQSAVELDRQIQEQRESASRGRELSMTPAEKAAEELSQRIADIREYANRAVEESAGLPEDVAKIRDEMNKAIDRNVEDQARSAAPAIAELFDAVQNAVAQGPSRAALNVSDVSTSEGSRELTRLLRGEDAARNANLAELQKQSVLLKGILDEARANGRVPIADMK